MTSTTAITNAINRTTKTRAVLNNAPFFMPGYPYRWDQIQNILLKATLYLLLNILEIELFKI
jgi:hypothetical protein